MGDYMNAVQQIVDDASKGIMAPAIVGAPLKDLVQREQFALLLNRAMTESDSGNYRSLASDETEAGKKPVEDASVHVYERISFFNATSSQTARPCVYWCAL